MSKNIYRVGVVISTMSLLASSFAGVVGASVTGTALNSTTGADSYNEAEVEVNQATFVTQSNQGTVVNEINLNANTGGNEANKNTGAGHVETGDVETGVGVSTSMNLNVAHVEACGGCDMDLYAANEKTGYDSRNSAEIELEKTLILDQQNSAYIRNEIDQDLNTGNNEANKNTGMGDVSTGDVESVSLVENLANKNMALVGAGSGSGSAMITASNDTTGADSRNEAEVKVNLESWATQSNFGYVLNDVDVDANTGWNEANKNTGVGDISTGDVDTGIGLSSSLNANFLNLDACCDVELGMANYKTGADSKNEAEAKLNTVTGVAQSNCDNYGYGLGIFGGENYHHGFFCGVANLVKGDLNTGDNETNKNTADGIDSGDVEAAVEVMTEENQNVLGDSIWDLPDVQLGELPDGGAWWMLFFGVSA